MYKVRTIRSYLIEFAQYGLTMCRAVCVTRDMYVWTERWRQGRLRHEHRARLAEGLHRQGRRRVHPGRRHPDQPPRPGA